MCVSLIRTAYSPNIKERADCSTAICDLDGRTLALFTHAPAHLGSTLRARARPCWSVSRSQTLRPGDVFFANDPYIVGVTHLNDCTVATPVFFEGGRSLSPRPSRTTPTSAGAYRAANPAIRRASSRKASAFRRCKLSMRASGGRISGRCSCSIRGRRITATAICSPRWRRATRAAPTALQELLRRYGRARSIGAIDEMLDATERRARAASSPSCARHLSLRRLGGRGRHRREPIRMAVKLTVEEDSVEFDLSGCDAQLADWQEYPAHPRHGHSLLLPQGRARPRPADQ